jgi:hypothetical protein
MDIFFNLLILKKMELKNIKLMSLRVFKKTIFHIN